MTGNAKILTLGSDLDTGEGIIPKGRYGFIQFIEGGTAKEAALKFLRDFLRQRNERLLQEEAILRSLAEDGKTVLQYFIPLGPQA